MTYVKQTWANGPAGLTPISAARLNYMEDGIENPVDSIPLDTYVPGVESEVGLTGVAKADLPVAGQAGRLARVSDDARGLWVDTGTSWVPVGIAAALEWFGAKGDGVTDDSTAVQLAFDSMSAAGGGELVANSKTYRVRNIKPTSNVALTGTGWNTIFKHTDDASTRVFDIGISGAVSNVTLRNFRVDGNRTFLNPPLDSGEGIRIMGTSFAVTNISITDVWVDDASSHGIYVGSAGTATGEFPNTVVVQGCIVTRPQQSGIAVTGGRRISIVNNVSDAEIKLEPNNPNVREVSITGNVCSAVRLVDDLQANTAVSVTGNVMHCGGTSSNLGFRLAGGDSTYGSVISGNSIFGGAEFKQTAGASFTANQCKYMVINADSPKTAKNLIISGNSIRNEEHSSTFTDGVADGTTTYTSATAKFVTLDAGKPFSGTNVPGGTTVASVTNRTTVVLSAAVPAGSGLSFTITRDPKVVTTDLAVVYIGARDNDSVTLANNYIGAPSSSGIVVRQGSRLRIVNNRIRDVDNTATVYGIRMYTGTITDPEIVGNTIEGFLTGVITISSSPHIIGGRVSDNSITARSRGYELRHWDSVVVNDNRIAGNSSNRVWDSINPTVANNYFYNPGSISGLCEANTCTRVTIRGNTFANETHASTVLLNNCTDAFVAQPELYSIGQTGTNTFRMPSRLARIRGTATLAAGTVTVASTRITASTRFQFTGQDNNVTGALRLSARTVGTNFTITSSVAGDTGVVFYEFYEPIG